MTAPVAVPYLLHMYNMYRHIAHTVDPLCAILFLIRRSLSTHYRLSILFLVPLHTRVCAPVKLCGSCGCVVCAPRVSSIALERYYSCTAVPCTCTQLSAVAGPPSAYCIVFLAIEAPPLSCRCSTRSRALGPRRAAAPSEFRCD